jgi:predicted DNA-binding transcriptional regulator AlpA
MKNKEISARDTRNEPPLLHSEAEVEALTGISKKTLQGWRLRGIGPRWIRAGQRLIRYPSSSLRQWLDAQPSGGGHQAVR